MKNVRKNTLDNNKIVKKKYQKSVLRIQDSEFGKTAPIVHVDSVCALRIRNGTANSARVHPPNVNIDG